MHIRQIIFFKEYFLEFYKAQTVEVRKKIDYVINIVGDVPYI